MTEEAHGNPRSEMMMAHYAELDRMRPLGDPKPGPDAPILSCEVCGNDRDFWAVGTSSYFAVLDGHGRRVADRLHEPSDGRAYVDVTCSICGHVVRERMIP